MKNVVSKVLMMFVVSFMLFTCSYAEFNAIPKTDSDKASSEGSSSSTVIADFKNMFESDTGYSTEQIISISFYKDSSDVSKINTYVAAMNTLSAKGYHFIYSLNTSNNSRKYYFIKTSSNFDVGKDSSGYLYFCVSAGDFRYSTDNNSFNYVSNYTSSGYVFVGSDVRSYHNSRVKNLGTNMVWTEEKGYYFEPTLCNAVGDVSVPDTPLGNLIDSETFKSMISDLTQSDLFYQNVPSSHRKYFFVQYDTEKDRYIFYFYPSNYSIQGLLMNENDYYLISSEDFSWWENVVNFVQGLFKKENEEGFDYKMVYASVLEDGSFDYWFRNKSNEILDKTLFNFDNSPLVFSMVDIPFFGKHSGGGIDLDTGDKTLASSPESSLIGQTFEENPLELNPNPTTEVPASEQSFWSKILDRLSDIKSGFLSIPKGIFDILEKKTGSNKLIFLMSPLFETIIELIGLLIACLAFMGRAITFVYTLPTIEASSALFSIDVDTTTKELAFTGNTWGTHFLSGLDKLKALSWGGASLWSFFEAFVVALIAVMAIKFVRKHYHI